jgi:hypothetical protein
VNIISKTLLFLSLFIVNNLFGQTNVYTISGVVKASESGEVLIGASVYFDNGALGALTNEYGFYSISIPQQIDSCLLIISYIGYGTFVDSLKLDKNLTRNVELLETVQMKEIVVTTGSNLERINDTQMGTEEMTTKEAKKIVAIFGEVDAIKLLQLKPGVQSGVEGTSGIYVRGGGADQNLFLLDEATIYNPSHLLGLFSTFNADIVKNVKLYKAGFPAQFGSKLSSVIDIRTREGNRKDFHVLGGVGITASRLSLEGPLKKDKGAFIVSARTSYVNLLTSLLNETNKNNPNWSNIPDYYFYDFNVKLNYDVSPKDRIFFSGYLGRDAFTFRGNQLEFNLSWGNTAGTLRWNRIISPQLFMNTSFTFSDYNYDIKSKLGEIEVSIGSGIRDVSLKTDFTWLPLSTHEVRFGGNAIYHRFSVGQFRAKNTLGLDLEAGTLFHAGEFALYGSDDWKISKKLSVLLGVRFSGFYNNETFYPSVEPRLAINYKVHKRVALKASYARMNQYLHLVSTSGATLPTSTWYPSSRKVKPQASDLVAASISVALGKDFFINVEGYYKWLHNQIDFKDGAKLFVNNNLEDEFLFGKGYSYGGEIYLEKKNGNLRGWIGYTLSWTWRKFDQINGGVPYHPQQDRRHDLSVVVTWDIPWKNPKFPLTLSASWIYGTGTAVSLPTKRYIQMDITGTNLFQFIPIYEKRGGFQMPTYHRLDIGLVLKLFPLKRKRFQSDLTFSVYNVYDRRNTFFMYIDAVYEDGTGGGNGTQIPEKFQAKIVSLFPIIPSITWNFKW